MTKHKKIARRLPHYLPLFGIFTAGALAFILFTYDGQFQKTVVISVCVAHIAWGVVHHSLEKDLTFEVFLEYVAISLLGLVIVLSLLGSV